MRSIILALQNNLPLFCPMARAFAVTGILCSTALSACVSPTAINTAMVSYDRAVLKAENELLMSNLLRARDDEPMHFTVTPSIAATFNFQVNGGLLGHMFSSSPKTAYNADSLRLNLGAEASESPTAQIVPIQGEEFTRRILMPLDQNRFEFLTNQTSNLSAILRLTVQQVEIEDNRRHLHLLRNSPSYREEYILFRRYVQQLAYLYATNNLYIGPLIFEEHLEIPESHSVPETLFEPLLEGRHRLERVVGKGYVMSHTVVGRTVIINQNPSLLSNQERIDLNRRLESMKNNVVPIIIRPNGPGAVHVQSGAIRLRSFAQMMKFLGHGLDKEPEFEVEPDLTAGILTGPSGQLIFDPPQTFTLSGGTSIPPKTFISTEYKERAYWIEELERDSKNASRVAWDLEIFGLLYQIFQLAVGEGTQTRGLPITIAK